ncbi:MAG: Flp pilus assembly complex ATPase component TadA [Candidatus Eremiobacteraeota bacterium]|nr:Flp pilus assembly complex ATPase component TadA [Candidatus Eremiobacteraeota bacterium]
MGPAIYFLVGSKGGVGATTISIDVARKLAERGRTLIVDADLSGRRSGAVVFNLISQIDQRRTGEDFGVVPAGKNLTLFEMTPNIHGGFTIKPDKVEQWFGQTVAANESYVVLDAPQPFAGAVRPFAVRAAAFALVVEPTLLGITGARAMQLELMKFGVPHGRLVAILCQRDSKPEISRGEIEKSLQMSVLAEIPPCADKRYDRAIATLATQLIAMPSADLLTLQPSASTPLGERRLGRPEKNEKPASEQSEKRAAPPPTIHRDKLDGLKSEIHSEISKRVDFVAIAGGSQDPLKIEQLRAKVDETVAELVAGRHDIGSAEEIAHLRKEIIDEALGLGPLEDLMADPAVTEIMVNGPENVYVERGGKLTRSQKRFNDSRQLRLVIERIITPLGRHIDEAVPMVDARLLDGSRVNATIEPLSIDGPTLTIRRFSKRRMGMSDLVAIGSATAALGDLLRAAVEARLNIVISGGTGSGKTTLLNILSSFIPSDERIVTIEDAAELALHQDHVVRLEARPANVEGAGEIRIRDLVKNSLRMRPDRIVVGECRGGEALDMLQAMNTGHDGSLTTIHANTPRDCLSRIETMVLMSGYDIPMRAIREQISGAVDLVVQTSRMRDGTRKITMVSEVVGMESDVITMQDLIRFDQQGVDKQENVAGSFVYTGVQPVFLKRLEEYGITLDMTALNAMKQTTSGW